MRGGPLHFMTATGADAGTDAALAGLELGEVICVPGLPDPALIDAVGRTQQELFLTAASSGLADRYQPAGAL